MPSQSLIFKSNVSLRPHSNKEHGSSITLLKTTYFQQFGKRFLVTLFKCCENTCGLKNVVKICVMVFKYRKLLFKQQYQTPPILSHLHYTRQSHHHNMFSLSYLSKLNSLQLYRSELVNVLPVSTSKFIAAYEQLFFHAWTTNTSRKHWSTGPGQVK